MLIDCSDKGLIRNYITVELITNRSELGEGALDMVEPLATSG